MIDTHCHLNFHSFKKDYRAVAQAAFDAGVKKIINVGAKLDSSRRAIQLAHEIPYCFAAVGVHPHHADEFPDVETLEKELSEIVEGDMKGAKKIVAIGECGLDYHNYSVGEGLTTLPMGQVIRPVPTIKTQEAQIDLLRLHLKLAKKFHLPLIIHCRDAYSDLISLLLTTNYKLLTGVIHCFQGSPSDLKQFLDLGFYIGYDGYITYAKNYEELVHATPLDRILTETDSPWLTPVPLRGKRNEPTNIKLICEKIAEIKSVALEEINQITSNNANKLFFSTN